MHAVAACIARDDGRVESALGSVDEPVFLRSSIKPFIAAAVVASGAADAFGFADAEIALIAASHSGEPAHVDAARSMLSKSAIAESALRCGAHPPSDLAAAAGLRAAGRAPGAIHNNCSGKHAGILALAKVLGAPLDGYLEPSHPAQRALIGLSARVFNLAADAMPVAVDGCGIPTVAVSLRHAARGFARFAGLTGLADRDAAALARVKAAMIACPWYVGGTSTFDTALIEATGGSVVGKGGAEGVHADALNSLGLGLALKVIDGGRRAVAPATVVLLEAAGALGESARNKLAEFAQPAVRNVAGKIVGSIEARLPPSP
jgi:L-asparaginase II